MKILVIQQKMIGDVLTSSILFEALRRKYPNAQLHYLINEHTFPVVQNHPFIDQFIFFTKAAKNSKKELLKLALSVKASKYDVVIDVYSKLSSNIITLFSAAKTKISYHKTYTTFVYTHNVKRKKASESKSLAIENRLQLLEPLDIDTQLIKPKIYLSDDEIEQSKVFLKAHGINLEKPIVMIGVLGSGANKTYPHQYIAEVIDTVFTETNAQILFNYIPKQKELAEDIYNNCNKETQQAIFFNVFGNSLREFLSITHHCNALIGNEGGAVNMAKALSVPTFSIFSPWIDKATWSLFEDEKNISVHLKDFKPEIYTKPEKTFKNDADKLYKKFTPNLFKEKLVCFLKNIKN
ncbi:glycosyltransferase family 9 protein [Tamlana crocina]|uniref:Glycosyltransferase family 9 protein n=1 Tax=Tamlana crocina TaxID=393006 RepID=A0ABX1DFA6_9FLAO|nr:glycosyltransferase family 9 protein [Tamlana crocina]